MRLHTVTSLALLVFASTSVFAANPPCSCIQEMWVDYPGPYDLYFSLSKYVSCNDEAVEDLWYGLPSNSIRPQVCEDGNYEDYEGDNQRVAMVLPGHGQELVGVKAWEIFRVGLEAATRKAPGLEFGSPQYHKIPQKSLSATSATDHDMFVIAIPMTVHVKNQKLDGKTFYFCVQLDSADGLPISPATFDKATPGAGSQLHIDYRVNGEARKGLVWLK